MKYYIDLDNTLCETNGTRYEESVPIWERIEKVRQLKDQGHHITIWTGRGCVSKIDYRELTEQQLNKWNVPYDELLIGKPDYDCYIDDKSHHVDHFWRVPLPSNDPKEKSKKLQSEIVPKGWGHEVIFVNNPEYCGKILHFEKGKKFSMHYHVEKKETWYIAKGRVMFHWIESNTGMIYSEYLNEGDCITNERGEAHQVEALEETDIFEVSTRHFDSDSYRVWRGD